MENPIEYLEIKIQYDDDIRKLKLQKQSQFKDLNSIQNMISQIYEIDLALFRLQYVDLENDLITISNQENIEEINKILDFKKSIKFKILDPKSQFNQPSQKLEQINSFLQINFFGEMLKNEKIGEMMNQSLKELSSSKEFHLLVEKISQPFLQPTQNLDNYFQIENFSTPKEDRKEQPKTVEPIHKQENPSLTENENNKEAKKNNKVDDLDKQKKSNRKINGDLDFQIL